jgi:hypothetical protein
MSKWDSTSKSSHSPTIWGHFTSQIGAYPIIPNNKPLLNSIGYGLLLGTVYRLNMGFDEQLNGNITGISWEYTTHFTNSKVLLGPWVIPPSGILCNYRFLQGLSMGPTVHLLNCWVYGGYNHSYYML